jgi:hypothetical protein
MRAAVEQLRDRGVRLEQYDLPHVNTEDGISTTGDLREPWFRDPDGNFPARPFSVETQSPMMRPRSRAVTPNR